MLEPGVLQLGGARDRDLLCHQDVTRSDFINKNIGRVGRRIIMVHHLGLDFYITHEQMCYPSSASLRLQRTYGSSLTFLSSERQIKAWTKAYTCSGLQCEAGTSSGG